MLSFALPASGTAVCRSDVRSPATTRSRRGFRLVLALSAAIVTLPFAAGAQQQVRRDSAAVADSIRAARATRLRAVTVTATRTPTRVFETPQHVTVIDSTELRELLIDTPVDVMRDLPGLDVNGVGTNQTRPVIRGQRGQRVLLLEDGLRLNNSRRQQDFGELPALTGMNSIERVEIVRGPSSVLYGTDAIGGVVNVISSGVPLNDGVHGTLSYRAGSADRQSTPGGSLSARSGAFALRASASFRETESYKAPEGSFGDISIDAPLRVNDTGVRDRSIQLQGAWDASDSRRLSVSGEWYNADNAGFGWVDGAAIGDESGGRFRIYYPEQEVSRYTLGWRDANVGLPFADRFDVTTYVQTNDRLLNTDITVPFTPTAGLESNSRNSTEMRTLGLRAEMAKAIGGRHMLTWGVDWFRDRSSNSDSSRQAITGFGPPQITTSNTPPVPNAIFESVGAFAQGDLRLHDRVSLVLGARAQRVRAETRETRGVTMPTVNDADATVVGTANLLVRVRDDLNVVGSVGRGFRSPNLVERFYDGVASTGSGYQRRNPALAPEKSLNTEVGLRFARGGFSAETFVFRNNLRDGIRIEGTGNTVNGLPEFQNVNVERLRYQGWESAVGLRLIDLVDLSANYTDVTSKNISDPTAPTGDTYSNKLAFSAGLRPASGRWSLTWGIRHQGEQKDISVADSPIGPVLPSFTVQSLRASALLFEQGGRRTSLLVAVENLTDELYSEFSNTTFFRPEPQRNVQASLVFAF